MTEKQVEAADFSINGQVVIITGATGDIGSALAWGLASAGARLVCAGRNEEQVEALVSRLPGEAIGVEVDVTSESDVSSMVDRALNKFGRIDVLINNAGISASATIADMSLETWNKVLQVNLGGVFLCSRAVLKPMIAQGKGLIINMTSALGKRGNPSSAAYSASKAGVSNFTNVLHQEMANHGIRVVGIAPGLTNTKMIRGNRDEEYIRRLASQYPGGRLGQPEDVIGLVHFLCSDQAKYISGTDLYIRP